MSDKPVERSRGDLPTPAKSTTFRYERRSHALNRRYEFGKSGVEDIVLGKKDLRPQDPRLALLRTALEDPLQVKIVAHARGYYGGKPKDVSAIAKKVKIPVEQVAQILSNAEQTLKTLADRK